ncbi:MAG TPA: oxygen-insensitive NAD(P)H nitroreductase [Pseudomonadales bacterium]|nr:oxygen-insensitive NAD(P)H nitroreductase [Pseudomonadales bacterium]
MTPAELAAKRYATKAFDPKKTISAPDFAQLTAVMRLAPSSVNSQPWHFLVASDAQGKATLAAAAAPAESILAYNASKILNASHSVVYCAKSEISDEYLSHIGNIEQSDGRYPTPEARATYENTRRMFVNIHRHEYQDIPEWTTQQVYLNIGACLMAAAQLGIDAVPMEGIDKAGIRQAFDLDAKGLQPVAMICFGYASAQDFNAGLPKSRLPANELFTTL